ncbi:MAG: OmpA family protein [Gammaproteobacteria bacterium]|nr:OmpA family protein [Gammaproteobacteria bacterium]
MSKYAIVAVTALFAAGCATVNPYTGESQTSKAASGAMIGAATGAILGAATADNKKQRKDRLLKGAAIGGATGGGVGYYMDVQESKLRQKLQNTGVSVTRNGDTLILNMPGNVTFDSNQSNLKADVVPVLASVVEVLKEYNKTLIVVTGHTDNTGGDQYNQLLSESRARAVGDQLVRTGVDVQRVLASGFGKTHPIASNDTAEGRAQNRRVELTLEPIAAK